MKSLKILTVEIIIFFILINLTNAKDSINKNSLTVKEELYFNKQRAIEIKPGTKLESIFYFDNHFRNSDTPLTPLKGKYKTRLKIPKANLD